MKQLTTVVGMVVLLVASTVLANDNMMIEKAGGYTVVARFGKTPSVKGRNAFIFALQDETGRAITDASVEIEYYMIEKATYQRYARFVQMPAHGAKTGGDIESCSHYHAILDFSMSGPWHIDVKITRDGKEQTAKFTADVE